MAPHGEEGHVEGHIPHGRVGLEDGDDGYLDEHEEDRVLPGVGQDRQTEISQELGLPLRLLTLSLKPKITLQGTSGKGWLSYSRDRGARPSSRAENGGDPEMPGGGEEGPTSTRVIAHRDISHQPPHSQLRAFPQEPPRKKTNEVRGSLSLGFSECLAECN